MNIAMGIILVVAAWVVFIGAYMAYESYNNYEDFLTQKATTE